MIWFAHVLVLIHKHYSQFQNYWTHKTLNNFLPEHPTKTNFCMLLCNVTAVVKNNFHDSRLIFVEFPLFTLYILLSALWRQDIFGILFFSLLFHSILKKWHVEVSMGPDRSLNTILMEWSWLKWGWKALPKRSFQHYVRNKIQSLNKQNSTKMSIGCWKLFSIMAVTLHGSMQKLVSVGCSGRKLLSVICVQ